jgi:hypothetical protein
MMVLYGVGFAAVYGLLTLLNYQGWRQRRQLGLSRLEEILTLSYILEVGAAAAVGLLFCVVAWLLPEKHSGWAGMTYFLIAVHYRTFHVRWMKRKVRALDVAYHSPEAAE